MLFNYKSDGYLKHDRIQETQHSGISQGWWGGVREVDIKIWIKTKNIEIKISRF